MPIEEGKSENTKHVPFPLDNDRRRGRKKSTVELANRAASPVSRLTRVLIIE